MNKSYALIIVSITILAMWFLGCSKNQLPSIDSILTANAEDTLIVAGEEITVACSAVDADGDSIFYAWEASGGELTSGQDTEEITWKSPDSSGIYSLICSITDDETWDTLSTVSDSIKIHVQNYFPMSNDSWWYYDGFYWFVTNVPNTITRKVYSKEELGDNGIKWHIETTDSIETEIKVDSLDYYSVKAGMVTESIRFYHRLFPAEGVICEMPLIEGKSWAYDEEKTATVIEIKARGTEGFSFTDCAHIEIVDDTNPTQVRTIWLAPDVGIITDESESDGSAFLDYELVDYELK